MIHRILDLLKDDHSFFLLGARGTGKSTLIKTEIPQTKILLEIDLLSPKQEQAFLRDPSRLELLLAPIAHKKGWVVIDEIQKVPALLNVVHSLIEKTQLRFALTGSSARKLRKIGVNLLAGRASVHHLFPLTHLELAKRFNLLDALEFGALPKIFSLKSKALKRQYLSAYADTYLREEIRIEQLVKKLEPFMAFLEVSAQSNGEIVNFSKIAFDCGVDTKTVQTYFQILIDTHAGFFLKPFLGSVRKRERHNPKFYFSDLGAVRALGKKLTLPLIEATSEYGRAFEHFIVCEILRLSSYRRNDFELFYWRGERDAEVDLIIKRPGKSMILAEIKSSRVFDPKACATLERVGQSFKGAKDSIKMILIYTGEDLLKVGEVAVMPWQKALVQILDGR